jgi:transposase
MNFFQYRCELVAKVPRTWCRTDGVHQIQVPWARQGSGFTLMMEALVMLLSAQMPGEHVSALPLKRLQSVPSTRAERTRMLSGYR